MKEEGRELGPKLGGRGKEQHWHDHRRIISLVGEESVREVRPME